MSNSNKPKPDTLAAYLESSGYAHRKATLHTFLETRECEVDVPRTEGREPQPAWEFIYKCTETGAERRWGCIDRLVFRGLEN